MTDSDQKHFLQRKGGIIWKLDYKQSHTIFSCKGTKESDILSYVIRTYLYDIYSF